MAGRKIPSEAQKIFDKYTQGFVRRLKKEDALKMFTVDFKMTDDQAETMFQIFDKDQNDILSNWEYAQFYLTVGNCLNELFEMYNKIGIDSSGNVDMEKSWDVLKDLKTASGETVLETDLEKYLKAYAGEEKTIDFRKFINVFCRVRQQNKVNN